MEATSDKLQTACQGDIAITGMACLFPGAPNIRTYWENIIGKVDSVTDAPEEWHADIFYDPDSTNGERTYCKRGGFLGNLAQFDPFHFGVMPNSIDGSEPAHFLALRIAHEALADAGYGKKLPEGNGVEVILGRAATVNRGSLSGLQYGLILDQTLTILKQLHPEYTEQDLQTIKKELRSSLPPTGVEVVPGLVTNIITGRIANRFDFMGSNYTVDAACASSLIAVEIAMQDLRSKKCDLAVVGGVQASTPAPILMMFCQLNALSKKNKIRPFDKDADGTLLGEGVGMMVLKRREDAEAAGDRIYAVLKVVSSASDGRAVGLLAPRVEGEELALRRAYAQSGISPASIGLIEAHGTGTVVGDAAEIEALARVFGVRGEGEIPSCALGSVKSMISHLIPAAGIAGLIKSALALYHRVLPPTLNVDTPHPDVEKTCCYLNTETRPWIHGQETPRRVGVNAFGFGGINAHAILEEYPINPTNYPAYQQQWPTELCLIQAESRTELIRQCEQVERFAAASPTVELKDVAYSLNSKLRPESVRLAIIASSVSDLSEKLARALPSLRDPRRAEIKDPSGIYFFDHPLGKEGKVAFAFPGEGSQYVNMLSDLCIHFPLVRTWFDIIERSFLRSGSKRLPSHIIFPPPLITMGDEFNAQLWDMDLGPATVFAANQAIFSLLFCLGIHPQATVGHSTGEYSALLGCGAIKWVQSGEEQLIQSLHSLNNVYEKCSTADSIPTGTLLVVSGGEPGLAFSVLDPKEKGLYLAMDNCPHQTILFGSEASIQKAAAQLRRKGAICSEMPFGRAYHTPLFQPFTDQVGGFFSNLNIVEPMCDMYSCATAAVFPRDPEQIRSLAISQWARPVRFRETIQAMYDAGVRVFLEVGPRGNLTAFIEDILSAKPHLAVAADVQHRAGTTQLNHMLGLLAAHGLSMYLHYLYLHRAPKELSFDGSVVSAETGRKSRSVKLAMGLPLMRLPEGFVLKHAETSPLPKPQMAPVSASSLLPAERPGAEPGPMPLQLVAHSFTAESTSVKPINGSNGALTIVPEYSSDQSLSQVPYTMDSRAQIIQAHLRTMEEFLETQRSVMQAFFVSGNGMAETTKPAPASAFLQPEATGQFQTLDAYTPEPVEVPSPVPGNGKAASAQVAPTPEKIAVTPASEPLPNGFGCEELSRIFLGVIADKTGYPAEMIELHLDLEADLGIDSIKRIEILGTLQQLTNLPRSEDMERVTKLRTAEEVIAFLTQPQEPTTALEAPEQQQEKASPAREVTRVAVSLPLLKDVVPTTDSRELKALIHLDPDEHLFLQHHTLGEPGSEIDPGLTGLPFVPLTFTLELLAEAAAALAGDMVVTGMERVRANRWIMLEQNQTTLQVTAKRSDTSASRVDVRIQAAVDPGALPSAVPSPVLAEATVLLANRYGDVPDPTELPGSCGMLSKWSRKQIYENVMFHGASFQGILSIDATGEDGTEATIRGISREGLLRSSAHPDFLFDPVVLDVGGQVFAAWAAEKFTVAFHLFPFEVEKIELFGPSLEEGEEAKCRVHVLQVTESQIRCNFEIIRKGRVRIRVSGWRDKRVDFSEDFWHFICRFPRETILSTPWTDIPSRFSKPDGFLCCRLTEPSVELLESSGGIWHRAFAYSLLSRSERETWRKLRTSDRMRIQWLRGRMALKDAVRMLLRERYGLVLLPADIQINEDEHGRPVVSSIGDPQFNHLPRVSLTNIDGTPVAAAIDDDDTEAMAVDIERLGAATNGFEHQVFLPDEQSLLSGLDRPELEEWKMRLWCAKKALAKALGGAVPKSGEGLVIKRADTATGRVEVGLTRELAKQFAGNGAHSYSVYTLREKDWIIATSILKGYVLAPEARVA
jgi:acyl transferase domain-containing protein/phosphopantetheinyl transferase